MKDLKSQTKIEYFRSSGPGGQRRNKKETAVRLKHLPTGITAVAQEFRYQAQNLKLAFERLQKRLEKFFRKKKPRIPTKIPRSVKEVRLDKKKRRSKKKMFRRKVDLWNI